MSDTEKAEPLDDRSLAAEGREGFQGARLHERLARYGKAKANALQFRDFLLGQGEFKLASALRECGNYLVFREYVTLGEVRLSKICTCKKHLICPLCAIRRGARALRLYVARVKHLLAENPRLFPVMVTLTVKDGPDLEERFAHLVQCLRAYHRRRSRSRQSGEVLKASSAVWSFETKRGSGSGMWHPHLHAVWLVEEMPDQDALRREWHSLTGDSFMCDVRRCDMSDPVGAFLEVFKYAVKFGDLPDADRLHAFRVLGGKRLQDSFGELRGLDVDPGDSDDLIEDLPYMERLYVYSNGNYVLKVQAEPDDDPLPSWFAIAMGEGWSDQQILEFMKQQERRMALPDGVREELLSS